MNIKQIGIIKSKFKEPANSAEMKKHESIIVIDDKYQDGLFKIEDSEYIEVVYLFNKAKSYNLKLHTFTGELKGVFASRSPRRPNFIGITTVKLIERKGKLLIITGLDALDNSPVLDIKAIDNKIFEDNKNEIQTNILKSNPRIEIMSHVWANETHDLLLEAGQIHGHYCTGLAMGVLAATRAMHEIREESFGLENLIAIVENNNCFSDGIQFVTACTFGNNSLIFKDLGKQAFTLSKRNGKAVRILEKPEAKTILRELVPEFTDSYEKVIKNRSQDLEEIAKFKTLGIEKAFATLNVEFNSLFTIENVEISIPEYSPVYESYICENCLESTMSSRTIEKDSKHYCLNCSDSPYYQFDGFGLSLKQPK